MSATQSPTSRTRRVLRRAGARHDFDRFASTLFVAADIRRALLALYAFNLEISRMREQVSQPMPGEIRLQWWSDMLAGAGQGGVEGNPVAAELCCAIGRYGLPVEPLSRLIDAHQFDLYDDPMASMAALEAYATTPRRRCSRCGARILVRPIRGDRPSGAPRRIGLWIARADRGIAGPCRRGGSCSCRCNCWSAMARHRRRVRGQGDAATARGAGSAHRRGAHASEDGVRAAGERAAGGSAAIPAAGAGRAATQADGARGQRSVCAAGDVAATDAVDPVAGGANSVPRTQRASLQGGCRPADWR